jgi:RNA polymerase sigma factor (TIGR02999 family)
MTYQPEGTTFVGRARPSATPQERRALDDVFSLVYEELRRLASFVRRGDGSVTLNSTALVHEAWLKLKDSPHLANTSVPHFKAIAAQAMRQVLVDAARRRNAQKRSAGEAVSVTPQSYPAEIAPFDVELLALDAALEKLAGLNARQAQVVECRFFGGLSVSETAALLQVSESVVERDWRAAKAWLTSTILPGKD